MSDYDDELADSGYYDDYEDQEVPYCDECGTTLVDKAHCYHDHCKANYDHCTNTWCGNSPHCGEDWY